MNILIVDGYNIIHQWDFLKREIESVSLESSRNKLISLLSEYQSWTGERVILVFDGRLTNHISLSKSQEFGLEIIFTSQKQTADSYIERFVYKNKNSNNILLVSTSDIQIQRIIFGMNAIPVSAERLKKMVQSSQQEWKSLY